MEQEKYLIENELATVINQLRQLNAEEKEEERKFELKFFDL